MTPTRNGIPYSNELQTSLENEFTMPWETAARRQRIKNWKHAGLILLSLPLVALMVISGILFVPAFWALRYLAEIEYDG